MLKKITVISGFVFFCILLLSAPVFAIQNGVIRGTVRDVQSKDILPFANIVLVGTGLGDAADVKGNYIIRNVQPGKYTLRATYLGYKSIDVIVEVTDGGKLTQDFNLAAEGNFVKEVVVTAQAKGQYEAINEQLNANTIKNVVSLAKIQELPDANAAESVSRLPGVSLVRTGGEGSKVVVRGLSPQYNRVTIDGVEMPANTSSSDPNDHKSSLTNSDELSLSGDRATDLSMISSNMLGGIEVIKAITPDMDATVFGGVINFSMRKAQKPDSGSRPQFEIVTQGSYNNLKDSYKDYKLVGSYEQRFFDNSFGIFAQGSAEDKNLSANQLSADYNFSGKTDATDEGVADFQSMTLTDVVRDRKRYGATVVFDYAHETGSIGFMNFYSRSNTKTISRAESYYLLEDYGYYSATNSKSVMDVYSNLLNVKQSLFGVQMEAKFTHSYSTNENPDDVNFKFKQNKVGFANEYNALKHKPPKEIATHVVHNPEYADFFEIYNTYSLSKDRTLGVSLDFSTDLMVSDLISSKVKAGGAYQYRDRSYDYNQNSGSVFYDDGGQVSSAILRAFPQFGSTITASDFYDPNYSYGEFLKGDYKLQNPLNVDLMLRVMDVAKANPGVGSGGGYKLNKLSSLLDDYNGNEKRSAGYAMADFNIGPMVSVLPGFRYQNLTTEYSGIRGEAVPGGIIYTNATETQSHGYLLPMLHFQVRPADWMQFHFAYTNTLNYPDYNTIIPKYYVGTNFIIYNNYRLKPATSQNFDAVLSLYSNELGLFSFGAYKKSIKNLIYNTKSYPKDFSAYPDLYDKLKSRTESFTLFTYINNPYTIDIFGIETEWQTHFWYLPEPFSGLILDINYTHIFSEAKYPKTNLVTTLDSNYIQQTTAVDTFYTSRLLDQPNDIINIALGYDYAGFSMRVSMLYQDNIFKKPDFWLQNRVQSKRYVRFDLSVKQELPWYGIQVYFNLNNISGEDDVDINQKTTFITSQQRYGMTADLGFRIKF
jgi:TonB-dependent receptor